MVSDGVLLFPYRGVQLAIDLYDNGGGVGYEVFLSNNTGSFPRAAYWTSNNPTTLSDFAAVGAPVKHQVDIYGGVLTWRMNDVIVPYMSAVNVAPTLPETFNIVFSARTGDQTSLALLTQPFIKVTCPAFPNAPPVAPPLPAPPFPSNNWITVLSKGSYGYVNLGSTVVNTLFSQSVPNLFVRHCVSCVSTHREVYYRRLTGMPLGFSVFDNMASNWSSYAQRLNTDFGLYSTQIDALAGSNGWQHCSYDDPGVGFPKDCSPVTPILNQWNSFNDRLGQTSVQFQIYTGALSQG